MSDGSDLGSDSSSSTTYGPPVQSPPSPTPSQSDHCPDGPASSGGLIDIGGIVNLGGLIGGPGSLIDVDLGQGDTHTAAILDFVVGSDDLATASVLGGDTLSVDAVGFSGLLDDCSLLT